MTLVEATDRLDAAPEVRIARGRQQGWRGAAAPGGILAAMLGVLVLLPIAISVLTSTAPSPARCQQLPWWAIWCAR